MDGLWDRYDNITIPGVFIRVPGPVPDANTTIPDFDELANRTDDIKVLSTNFSFPL